MKYPAVGHRPPRRRIRGRRPGAAERQPESAGRQAGVPPTGVELINVTATVTDGSGRFVSGLRKEDFASSKTTNCRRSAISAASACRSALASSSTRAAAWRGKDAGRQRALNRFLELLGPDDEVFLYRFDSNPELVHGWTTDRQKVSRNSHVATARVSTGDA